jgi:hypothetical protein
LREGIWNLSQVDSVRVISKAEFGISKVLENFCVKDGIWNVIICNKKGIRNLLMRGISKMVNRNPEFSLSGFQNLKIRIWNFRNSEKNIISP